jgi:excisionase family DNA binding protein
MGGEKESRRVDLQEAAEYLGVAPRTLRRLKDRDRIRYYKLGAKVVFDTADLDEYLARHLVAEV